MEGGQGRPQIGNIQAPQLSFSSIRISTSEAKLAWLYNAVADLAHAQIQAVIIREVSKQVFTVSNEHSGKEAAKRYFKLSLHWASFVEHALGQSFKA